MNRVIKFRVWDEDRKKMVFDFHDRYNKKKYKLFYEDGRLFCGNEKDNGDWQQPELMQFTGLLLNGKEIYDGDILGGHPHGTVAVRWNSKYACFECFWNEDAFGDEGEPFERERSDLLANQLDDCKDAWNVIGNIYQNPDLLNQ